MWRGGGTKHGEGVGWWVVGQRQKAENMSIRKYSFRKHMSSESLRRRLALKLFF